MDRDPVGSLASRFQAYARGGRPGPLPYTEFVPVCSPQCNPIRLQSCDYVTYLTCQRCNSSSLVPRLIHTCACTYVRGMAFKTYALESAKELGYESPFSLCASVRLACLA